MGSVSSVDSGSRAPRVLIAFASHEGQTEKIVRRVASTLRARGVSADVARVEDDPKPDDHDAVVVAGPIHGGRHDRRLLAWARAHATALSARPTAMLTVSLTAYDERDDAGDTLTSFDARLREATGWAPDDALHVAGALNFGAMNPLKRWGMGWIARSAGLLGKGQAARGRHEFTDWDRVDAFARYVGDRARPTGTNRPT